MQRAGCANPNMKSTADKTSTTVSASALQAANQPFFTKAGEGGFFVAVSQSAAPAVQAKMRVGRPDDRFEQEADRMADKVMRSPGASADAGIGRAGAPKERLRKENRPQGLQRKGGDSMPAVDAGAESAIRGKTGGGQPLAPGVRDFMESRFGADFSNVRVHADTDAAALSNRLSARAFTHENHVFFSRNEYQPETGSGRHLLAHELTHTIQQGHAVQRSPKVSVTTSPPAVQRLGVQDALDYFADKADYLPGFRLLTIVIGFNPINRRSADRSAANILRALIELVPGGALIAQALANHGVFSKAGAWVEKQLTTLGDIGGDLAGALRRFIDSLGWSDIFDLGGVWDRAKAIFGNPLGRILSFAGSVVTGIMQLVKDTVLRPLAKMAEGTAGYGLLKAVLGQDPITGDPVPRNAETLIGGFMKLIGQEEIWENIKRGNAVARAWAWFEGALAGVLAFARAIPARIAETVSSITWQDVVTIVGVFGKVGKAFLDMAGRFFSWAGAQVISLLEIIFSVVAPGAVPYIKKAQNAFHTIIKNPVGFAGNLVRAGKLGFQKFASKVGEHLNTALIKWIVGPLGDAGVYIPKAFSLIEIVKLVLSVLGLTWQNIRGKLVKIIPEPVLVLLEKTAGIVVTLVKDGPAAAWEQIKTELSELKDMLVAKITEMVTSEVVKAAVVKLVSMLNPAGAVIQAIIAIYNTITFFIQKINQIAAVVASFIDSIAAIAAGQIENAAKKVEQTMANTLSVIIAFLAKFAGLGNIPDKVVGIIKKIRQPIDKGMDKIVAWLGGMLKRMSGAVAQAGLPSDPGERLKLGMKAAVDAVEKFAGRRAGKILLNPLLAGVKIRYGFQSLEVIPQGNNWSIRGRINPEAIAGTRVIVQTDRETGAQTTVTILSPPKVINFEFRRFTASQSVSIKEMTAGLQHHQTSLNNLTLDEWLANIYFRPFLRGAVAAEERDIARRDLIRSLRAEIDAEYKSRNVVLSKSQLNNLVVQRSRNTHASHSADFISGGNIGDFDSLEKGAVNSYIGSCWGRIRPDLESYAHFLRQTIGPSDRAKVKMNFRLRPKFLN
jgi:hypothetical protein